MVRSRGSTGRRRGPTPSATGSTSDEPDPVLHGDDARRLHRRSGRLARVALHARPGPGRTPQLRARSSPTWARSRWGRRRTSGFSSHEFADKDPADWKWPYEIPCWVFTHRELTVVPGAQVVFTSDPVETVHARMVEAAGGKNVWLVGGGDLVGQFADAGLLDEVIVYIAPVTLGAGKPLLPRHVELRLEETARNGDFVPRGTRSYATSQAGSSGPARSPCPPRREPRPRPTVRRAVGSSGSCPAGSATAPRP